MRAEKAGEMNTSRTERISSIDYFRAIAIFSVILIHTEPFKGFFPILLNGFTHYRAEGLIEFAVNQFDRFAVPFFYVMSGYFYGSKSASPDGMKGRQASYLKRILIIWIFWSVTYLFLFVFLPGGIYFSSDTGYLDRARQLLAFYAANPVTLLMIGGNLWFFPALLSALLVIEFFHRINMQDAVLPAAALLYGVALLSTSYTMETNWIYLNNILAEVKALKMKNIEVVHAFINSLLYVVIGFTLFKTRIRLSRRASLSIMAAGLLLSIAEVFVIYYYTNANPIDVNFLIGTVPLTTGLAIFAVSNPEIGRNSIITRCGRYTLGIYACHAIILKCLLPLQYSVGGLAWNILFPVTLWLLSLALVLLFSKNVWLRRVVV